MTTTKYVRISDVLKRGIRYDDSVPIPFGDEEKRNFLFAMVASSVSLILLVVFRPLGLAQGIGEPNFFFMGFTIALFNGWLDVLAWLHPLLLWGNAVSFVIQLGLVISSRGWNQPITAEWHWVGYAALAFPSVATLLIGGAIILFAAITLVHALLWAIYIVLATVFYGFLAMGILVGLANSA
jgi:hypothetical protein